MNRSLMLVASACCALLLNACGESSSSQPNEPSLTTQSQDINTYCANNPQDSSCSAYRNQMSQQTGLQPLGLNSNGQWQGAEFGLYNSASCQCQTGYQLATDDRGNLYCGRTVTRTTTVANLEFHFRKGSSKRKVNGQTTRRSIDENDVIFDLGQTSVTDETRVNPTGNCQSQASARRVCQNHTSCSGLYYQGQQAFCSPIVGENYGYCSVNQTL
ncbi:MAG: hypothetical protein KDD33_01135 [Bdellovibrionales bacterium]|nr:hypothetical protein [Bdellovibrionales bacterium]